MTPEKMSRILKTKDREQGCQTIFVTRISCFKKDGIESRTRLPDSTGAVVHAEIPGFRHLLPEENREDDFIIVYTRLDLTEGKKPDEYHTLLADVIEPIPGDSAWRVVRSKYWKEYGFYQVLAVRTEIPAYGRKR